MSVGQKLFEKTRSDSIGNPNAWKELADSVGATLAVSKPDWQSLRDYLWAGVTKRSKSATGKDKEPSIMTNYRPSWTQKAYGSGEGSEDEFEADVWKLLDFEAHVKRQQDREFSEAEGRRTADQERERAAEDAFRHRSGAPPQARAQARDTPGASSAPPPRGRQRKRTAGSGGSSSGASQGGGRSRARFHEHVVTTKVARDVSFPPSDEERDAIAYLDDRESNLWSKPVPTFEGEDDAAEAMYKPVQGNIRGVPKWQPFHRHDEGYRENVGHMPERDWADHHLTYLAWLGKLTRQEVAVIAQSIDGSVAKQRDGGDGEPPVVDGLTAMASSIEKAAESQVRAQEARVTAHERMSKEKVEARERDRADARRHEEIMADKRLAEIKAMTQKTLTARERLQQLEDAKEFLSEDDYAAKKAAIIASI